MRADCTILVVDDDDVLREAICDAIQDEGCAAVPAADGREALARLRGPGTRPCVIVLDLMMPVMNGWQFRAAQRQDAAVAEIPVIVVTAGTHVQHGSIDADVVLHKPFRLDELFTAVERFCG